MCIHEVGVFTGDVFTMCIQGVGLFMGLVDSRGQCVQPEVNGTF